MTRNELNELQMLMSTEPEDLSDEQKIRLIDLKGLFEKTMPANTSPLPTTRTGEERPLGDYPGIILYLCITVEYTSFFQHYGFLNKLQQAAKEQGEDQGSGNTNGCSCISAG